MQFGKVSNPESVDFSLPSDSTGSFIIKGKEVGDFQAYIGCAKWGKAELKNFYPKGTKDELAYYSGQFNCIELNATFYRLFPPDQFEKWKLKTPETFKFFPKLNQEISHIKRLQGFEKAVDEYLDGVLKLENKLGECFLQLPENFPPKYFDRVKNFLEYWPVDVRLGIEFRHPAWYNDTDISNELYPLLQQKHISNIITDTAGRRDLLHMRLTNRVAFIRFVGANHDAIDYKRLDDWVLRIERWKKQGLANLYFFVHQNVEEKSAVLSAYFIQQLNKRIGLKLKVPVSGNNQVEMGI